MPLRRRRLFRLLLVIGIRSILVAGPNSRAQDEDSPPQEPPQAVGRAVELTQSFERWVFFPYGDEATARSDLDSLLEARIRRLNQVYGLTDAQERKLRLAARIEVGRRFEAVEQMRNRFKLVKDDRARLVVLIRELTPERDSLFADPFGERSFLEKVLAKTLVGKQAVKYELVLRERNLTPFVTWVDLLIVNDDQGLGLKTEQRLQLAELLRDLPGPVRGADHPTYEEVIVRLAGLPEARLRRTLDKTQWERLQRHFERARARGLLLAH